MAVFPVILAGGSGSRLWPMSGPAVPKQFLKLFKNRSLFQNTVLRMDGFCDPAVVKTVCGLLDERVAQHPEGVSKFEDLIQFVTDRPGHDQRYAIDASKINTELGWQPSETFETGIAKTIDWYLANQQWCDNVRDGSYQGERLGLAVGG